MDSNDKLKPYGTAFNGYIDGFSCHIMWMEAYSINSDLNVITDYFINTDTQRRCLQEPADPGIENGHVMCNYDFSCNSLTLFLLYYDFILMIL